MAQEVEAAARSDGGRGGRKAQIKKSRRYRNDRAGSSNKEWLYKQMLYSKD
ncbi:hypothetical protein [Aeromonas veronii]|uniref:hypothetical protein n=1 Tax=Aeromonas veronii TaxID=654 RepID=UPI002A6A8497|nr:hypothetical protein [Aeromonas veronii]